MSCITGKVQRVSGNRFFGAIAINPKIGFLMKQTPNPGFLFLARQFDLNMRQLLDAFLAMKSIATRFFVIGLILLALPDVHSQFSG